MTEWFRFTASGPAWRRKSRRACCRITEQPCMCLRVRAAAGVGALTDRLLRSQLPSGEGCENAPIPSALFDEVLASKECRRTNARAACRRSKRTRTTITSLQVVLRAHRPPRSAATLRPNAPLDQTGPLLRSVGQPRAAKAQPPQSPQSPAPKPPARTDTPPPPSRLQTSAPGTTTSPQRCAPPPAGRATSAPVLLRSTAAAHRREPAAMCKPPTALSTPGPLPYPCPAATPVEGTLTCSPAQFPDGTPPGLPPPQPPHPAPPKRQHPSSHANTTAPH